jgi:hypothetical protein
MINPNKAIKVLDKHFLSSVEIADYDDEGELVAITTPMYELIEDYETLEYALEDYKKVVRLVELYRLKDVAHFKATIGVKFRNKETNYWRKYVEYKLEIEKIEKKLKENM